MPAETSHGSSNSVFAKNMKAFLVAVLVIAFSAQIRASEALDSWSETVNGLRARLSVERDKDSPFVKVFLELQNTSDVAGIKTIRFTRKSITPTVTNKAGEELQRALGMYSSLSPDWTPLKLPFDGTMRFRISFPGLGFNQEKDKTIVDLGSQHSWIIPQEGEWFLSGSLKIDKQEGDHSSMDWSGTLSLPKIRIPQEIKSELDAAEQPATRSLSK